MNKKNSKSQGKIRHDERITLPKARGNGQLIRKVSVDDKNKVTRYNIAYINHRLCYVDNGRVLGYDNAHGYHHRHYMGEVEPINFISYEDIEEKFQREFEVLHERAKKK
ncbi:MAG: toxin-antitoxin system TumE family protein [Gammaproteobacteria bacterium]